MPVQQKDIDEHWIWPLVEQGLTVFPLGTAGEYPPHWIIERAGGDVEKAKELWSKSPRATWKEWQTSRPSDSQIAQWIIQFPQANFAIATGKEIDVVDADNEEAIEFVQEHLTRTPWMVRTGKGAHFYYQTNERLRIKNSADEKAKLDTRGFGGYVVAPGSTHYSGRRYEFESNEQWLVDNIKDLPCLTADDLEKIQSYKRGPSAIGGTAGNLAGFNAAHHSPAISGGVQEGGRNQNLTRLVGGWLNQGYGAEQVLARAMQSNAGNQPPLADSEVITIIQSVTATHLRNHAQDAASAVVVDAPDSKGLLLKPTDLKASAPTWLIKGVLPAEGIGVLFGPSGGGKSFVAIDLALSIAAGVDWHGRAVKRPGGVIYVCGEGQQGVGNRLRAWEAHSGLSIDDLPIRVTRLPIRFLDAASAGALLEAVESELASIGSVATVIVDTLNRNFGDGDENTTKDMTRFIDVVTDLQKTLQTNMLIVHHTGLGDGERARGSSALRAALDYEIQHKVAAGDDSDGPRFTLVGKKMKDGSHMNDAHFGLKFVPLGTDEDGDEYGSCVIEMTGGDVLEGAEIAAGLMKKLGPNEQKMLEILTAYKRRLMANKPDLTEVLIERKDLVSALKGAGLAGNKTSDQIGRAEGKKWLLPVNKSMFAVSQAIEI